MKASDRLEQAIFKYQTFIPVDLHFELREIASRIRKSEAVAEEVRDIVDNHEVSYPYAPNWVKEIRAALADLENTND